METIGVTNIDPWFVLDDDPLIKDLFYFDKLFYSVSFRQSLEKFCNTLPHGKESFKKKVREIEELEKAGLIYEYTNDSFNQDKLKYGDTHANKYALKALELALAFSTKEKVFDDVFIDFLERFREVGQLHSRVNSIVLNKKDQNTYTPIIRSSYHNFSVNEYYSASTVLKVLIKKFPSLSDDIKLENFVDFKNDPDTKLKLARLRDWTLEISKKPYSEKEIEQKIDYLLQEYAKQLEIHKLKYNLGYIETFVTTSLEVLENIAKLNFSKAARVLFDIGKQKINLLEAEQNMIGKELALLYELNNQNRL